MGSRQRDWTLWVYAGLVSLASIGFLSGGLTTFHESNSWVVSIDFFEVPLALLTSVAFLVKRSRFTDSRERRFWLMVALGAGCLAPSYLLGELQTDSVVVPLALAQDLFLAGYYLLISLALERRRRDRPGDAYEGVQTARSWATAVFVASLFAYFVILPASLVPEVYDSCIPSLFFYVVLDTHLVGRAAGLVRVGDRAAWGATGWLFLVGFSTWLALDLIELLRSLEFVQISGESIFELVWFLPYLPLLIAGRLQASTRAPAGPSPDARTSHQASVLGALPSLATQPLFYAAVLPTLHLLAAAAQLTDERMSMQRDLLVLAVLPILAGLSLLHTRCLERATERLEEERLLAFERDRQAERMRAVGRMAGGIAHDFNNLLQVIRGSLEPLLYRFEEDAETSEALKDIDRAAHGAAELTDQLLTIGHRKRMAPHTSDLNQVATQIGSMAQRVIGSGIQVQVQLDEAAGHVGVEPGSLEGVLLNLAINARDAMPNGGVLRIETSVTEDPGRRPNVDSMPALEPCGAASPRSWVRVSVIDTGVGMDAETKAHIFDPFFTTKQPGKGTGLGLSTAYGIVSQYGGFIDVDSRPGSGTEVHVHLPSIAPLVVTGPRKKDIDLLVPAGRPMARTILVVEDNHAVRTVISHSLTGHGFLVLEADCAAPALRLLEQGARPNLLLTDIVMPGMLGTDLARRIHERLPDTKILFMTGHDGGALDSPELRDRPLLRKPFAMRKLLTVVEEVLNEDSLSLMS